MPTSRYRITSAPWLLVCAVLAGSLLGCDSPEPITVYEVPTTVPDELLPGKDRMLAAMVPQGNQVWFFKVTGPEKAVESIETTYRDFVRTIKIEDGTPMLKDLPEGWRRGVEKPMRFASIDVDTPEKQLDISVSKLGKQEDWDRFVAMNVNRWRGQLGLPSSGEKWAGGVPLEVAAADGPSVWVDFTSDPSADAGTARTAMTPPSRPRPAPTDSASSAQSPVKYERPEGWRDGKMSSMRWAAFDVGPEESQASLTVIPAGGDLRGNIARWIGQIRPDVTDEIVDAALENVQQIDVDGRASQRFLLTGADAEQGEWIDVTIVPLEDGISLFIKMQGPATTVSGQSDNIASFLESLKLNL